MLEYSTRTTVLQGGLIFYSSQNGGDAYEKNGHSSFTRFASQTRNKLNVMDLMTFGLFLLALLTFIFTFCK